jgi:serine/threonine-protein kinase
VKWLAAYGKSVKGMPFGRYRLVELQGRGGMGEVWRAFDSVTERMVALKLLPAEFGDDEVFQERFRREAKSAAGLNEPHVVPIHDFGEIDGRLYVTMRLIEGRDLQTILADGPLRLARAVWIIDQIASALHAAHRIGLVHRDVKPSNILVTEDDFAYLIDFGIARAAGDTRLTDTGSVIGTWAYLAPERLTTGQADPRTDIYALACVLYECLTGSRPFPGDSLEQQLAGHLGAPPPRPSAVREAVSVELDRVIAKGMAKDPVRRYQSAKSLAQAARAAITTPISRPRPPMPRPPVLMQQPTEPARPPIQAFVSPSPRPPDPPPAEPPRSARIPRWLWYAAGAAVLVAVVLLSVLMIDNTSSNTTTGARSTTATSGDRSPSSVASSAPFTLPSFSFPTLPGTTVTNPSGATETVEYQVTGQGSALSVMYNDTGGKVQTEFNVTLPWRKEVKLTKPAKDSASVTVVNSGAQVTCTIAIAGVQVRTQTGTTFVACS